MSTPAQVHLQAPDEWEVGTTDGFGPFVTYVEFVLPDRTTRRWRSRRHRKSALVRARPGLAPVPVRTWWIASLFAFGAFFFALGSANAWIEIVSPRVDASTFFVGSLFFTTAAYLSFVEVAGTPEAVGPGTTRSLRLTAFRPFRIDWWAAVIQVAGTLFFNVSTFAAIDASLGARAQNLVVWWPDVAGSVCFLVSSYLSWAEVCHSAGRLRVDDISWWIVAINLAGSVAFAIAAVASRYVVDVGTVRNAQVLNTATLTGAMCFLVGAVLLVPEARRGLGD